MKILIINQHSMNHGDEAAGMALVRSLYNKGVKDITILYNMNKSNKSAFLYYENVKQARVYTTYRGVRHLLKLNLKYSNKLTCFLLYVFKKFRYESSLIEKADYIISAPGGVNMGLYKDYGYIWRLKETLRLKKSLAIYSPSIGPFKDNDYIKINAKNILSGADYLSLRDNMSFSYADDLKVNYLKSIDTAYLETPKANIPSELSAKLPEKYVVLVPNELYSWHPSFKTITPSVMDGFYRKLITLFTKKGINVVLLPQLFGISDMADEAYFCALKGNIENVFVVPSQYSSDIQQSIVKRSMFVVGARYHTIVFSINNKTPFVCLSYEHKMRNMLEILGVSDRAFDISYVLNNQAIVLENIWSKFEKRTNDLPQIISAHDEAKKIAIKTFESFLVKIGKEKK